jgi:hypothetical protein
MSAAGQYRRPANAAALPEAWQPFEDIALQMGIPTRTVNPGWKMAPTWLHDKLDTIR